jgi:hypothetical protein
MQVLLGVLVAALVGYVLYRAFFAPAASPQVASAARSERGFAFLSNGLIFYEAPRYGLGNVLIDTLLFPFRLLRAVFHFLNFFSLMYTRKPLTSASGPAVQADLKNILLQGRRIDAEKILRSARPVHGVPSLVPESWELVSRNQEGVERVLATNVASYDIGPDGTIVYSNGRGVFVLDQDGSSRLALTEDLVAEVVAGAG